MRDDVEVIPKTTLLNSPHQVLDRVSGLKTPIAIADEYDNIICIMTPTPDMLGITDNTPAAAER